MVSKLYQQLDKDMSIQDVSASFSDCIVYDKERDLAVSIRTVESDGSIMVSAITGRDTYEIFRSDLFSGRFDLFPPHEGMVLHDEVAYFASRTPERSYKKGLFTRSYTTDVIGDLHKNEIRFSNAKILSQLFTPRYFNVPDAWNLINNTSALSVPIGQWWAVGFSNLADGLAIYYKTTPVAKLFNEHTVTKINNNPAVLAMLRSQFPLLTWR